VLADCAEFRLRRVPLAGGERLVMAAGRQPRLLHVVRGEMQESAAAEPLERGANALLPFAGAFTFTAMEDSLLLVTENFT
jgi:mannose-6-phosphate isomerase